jgi:hypothetical protein
MVVVVEQNDHAARMRFTGDAGAWSPIAGADGDLNPALSFSEGVLWTARDLLPLPAASRMLTTVGWWGGSQLPLFSVLITTGMLSVLRVSRPWTHLHIDVPYE